METYTFGSNPTGPRVSDPPDTPSIIATRHAWKEAQKALTHHNTTRAALENAESETAQAYQRAQENAIYHNARDTGRTHDEAMRAVRVWQSAM